MSEDEHFPWHYTEFGVVCACGLPMDRNETCAVMRAGPCCCPDLECTGDPMLTGYCQVCDIWRKGEAAGPSPCGLAVSSSSAGVTENGQEKQNERL